MGGLLMIVLIVGVFLASHAVPAAPTAERGMEPATRDAEQVRREDGVRRCHELKGWKGVRASRPQGRVPGLRLGGRCEVRTGELVKVPEGVYWRYRAPGRGLSVSDVDGDAVSISCVPGRSA